MNEKPICNECRTTTVCVDAYENNNISGRLYNPCLERGSCFGGLMEFLTDMTGVRLRGPAALDLKPWRIGFYLDRSLDLNGLAFAGVPGFQR